MSVSVRRQSSSFSSRSISNSSGFSGQTRISTAVTGASVQKYAPSVYGGAGGLGTRISQPYLSFSSGSLTSSSETALLNNEKFTMQNLNDRLASYLEKVRTLESANRKLELQIREFCEKRSAVASKDFTGHFDSITNLRTQISGKMIENQRLFLQIDNAYLAAEDFRVKFEMELGMRTMVETDVGRLRGVRDSLTIGISDLELQTEDLARELVDLKTNHEKEMQELRIQQAGTVNVQVDCGKSIDLTKVLEDLREHYEAVVRKNQLDVEKWYHSKEDNLQMQITTETTEVKTSHTQLSELKRKYQNLEIARQGAVSEIQFLQRNLDEVNSRYSVQISQLQMNINSLELELQELRTSIEQQRTEYDLLLDIKMRLEMEIAEYRRLLEGEYEGNKSVTITEVIEKVESKKEVEVVEKVETKMQVEVVEKVEEHKPHIERRVRTIVEEIVDGKVVSSKVDTLVEDLQ
ncbi:keratin, type I cytoskeletal 19-like [Mastacembelus armatus]|uniref:Keratin 99 n=1 Tax=Mastacembelus armatus TaxID=205130 RepID=A0A3Q3LS48_9TELE|nr:keratin, type I cytoskeletal 19-like [Mastacembelus armatus]